MENNGYRVLGTATALEDVQENEIIHWNNFEQEDFYYDRNGKRYGVYANHDNKTVILYEE